MEEFSFKELYDVSLKTIQPIEFCGRNFEKGEIIAIFDKINIANIHEIKKNVSAKGGYNNANLVTWEHTQQVDFHFTQGVFSKSQFGLLMNANMIYQINGGGVVISKREKVNSDEDGNIQLKHSPIDIYIYDEEFNKLEYIQVNNKTYKIITPFKKVIVDYTYNHDEKITKVQIGKTALNGYLELEGKTRYKDDESGHVRTGIIKIPKLKLMSELSIRLGEYASPVVGAFSGVGYPVGVRGDQTVMEIYFLDDDIDSDI